MSVSALSSESGTTVVLFETHWIEYIGRETVWLCDTNRWK